MSEVAPNQDRLSLVEATIDFQMGQLSLDEQTELGNRLAGRFGWKQAGDLAVAETAVFEPFIPNEDDYDLTVVALSNLGVRIPAEYDKIVDAFEDKSHEAKYLGEHVARGDQPELTFHVPFSKVFGLDKMIKAFDVKQAYDTYAWSNLFKKYSAADHNQESYRQNPQKLDSLTASFALNDSTDPADRTKPANAYDEAGLVHVNKTVKEQREALGEESASVRTMSLSEYVVLQAKRQEAGLPLLDKPTITRFVAYPSRSIGGYSYVPDVNVSAGDQLRLYGTHVGGSWDSGGVRRVVRV